MKKYLVTFVDHFEAENEEDLYDQLLAYMEEMVSCQDVTAFGIDEEKEE